MDTLALQASAVGTTRANDSELKRDQQVFTHFPKDPICEICRMTQTTRARCKSKYQTGADGISRPTTRRSQILNHDDKPRSDHWNDLIVQDGTSHWLHSYLTKNKDAQVTACCLWRFLLCQHLQWMHDKNTPHRSDTRGIAEELFDE